MKRYEDILHLPRPKPRQEMTPWQRGAQFSPFAALTGFEDVIGEEGRLTQGPVELGEDAKAALNARLAALKEQEKQRPRIVVVWFCPDSRKEGGSFVTTLGSLKRLDEITKTLRLTSGEEIPLERVVWVDFSQKP